MTRNMIYYKSKRPVGGEPPIWVVVDETGNIVNRNPSKDELKGLEKEILPEYTRGNKKIHKYNETNICPRCIEENKVTDRSVLYPEKAYREKDKNGKETGRWICTNCWSKDYQKYDSNSYRNIMKSVTNCRTGNQNSSHESTKAAKSQELACELYGWIDLNKENDNYKFPLDCYDPKTGLYHQVQMRYYSPIEGCWPFFAFKRERLKKFADMVCFCISKDGKIVERIYKFLEKVVKNKNCACIYKNPTNSHGGPKTSWYDDYIVKDKEELKKANDIWKNIIDER